MDNEWERVFKSSLVTAPQNPVSAFTFVDIVVVA